MVVFSNQKVARHRNPPLPTHGDFMLSLYAVKLRSRGRLWSAVACAGDFQTRGSIDEIYLTFYLKSVFTKVWIVKSISQKQY